MQANDHYEATVIVPSYNQKHCIFDALNSILNQETDFKFEVIVVESTGDDTANLIRSKYPSVQVIELSQRTYPGAARNVAIKQARGSFLAFTDTDCIVEKHWLQRLLLAHRQGYKVVGGMVKNGTPFNLIGTLDYLLEFSDLITPYSTTNKTHFGTCNVSFSREIFDTYGLFADQVKGSDSQYSRLVRQKGEILFHQPEAIIWHRNRTNLARIFRNQHELGYGAAISRNKYDFQGKIFIRMPILIALLPFAKVAAIASRLLRYSPTNLTKFIFLSPLAFIVLSYFSLGFFRGRRAALSR
jgi:glycosyltransferase involved in cell wall biosynthesis